MCIYINFLFGTEMRCALGVHVRCGYIVICKMSTQYGLVAGKDQVPLQSVSVSGQIKGYVAGLDINLCYHNSSDSPLEVLFRFPVDEAMAVVGLEAKIAGRTIKGVVSVYCARYPNVSAVT